MEADEKDKERSSSGSNQPKEDSNSEGGHSDGEEGGEERQEARDDIDIANVKLSKSQAAIMKDYKPPQEEELDRTITEPTHEDVLKKLERSNISLPIKERPMTATELFEQRIQGLFDPVSMAVKSIIWNLCEEVHTSRSNLIKMGKLNMKLEAKIQYFEKTQKCDPRVMRALQLAAHHRTKLAELEIRDQEKERVMFDAKQEMRSLEEYLKIKARDMKLQENELKKLREIGARFEALEAKACNQEAELATMHEVINRQISLLKDQCAEQKAEIETNYKEQLTEKNLTIDKEIIRGDNLNNIILHMQTELTEKNRRMSTMEKAEKKQKEVMIQTRAEFEKMSATIRNLKFQLLKDSKTKAKLAKEFESMKSRLHGSFLQRKSLMHERTILFKDLRTTKDRSTKMKLLTNSLSTRISKLTEKLQQETKLSSTLKKDIHILETELCKSQKELYFTKNDVTSLNSQKIVLQTKYDSLGRIKAHQDELLRISENNAAALVRDIVFCNENIEAHKMALAELLNSKDKLLNNIAKLNKELSEEEYKDKVTQVEMERHKRDAYNIKQTLQKTSEKLTVVTKTNVDLYTETTAQAYLTEIMAYEMRIKEQEIKSLVKLTDAKDSDKSDIQVLEQANKLVVQKLKNQISDLTSKLKYFTNENSLNVTFIKALQEQISSLKFDLRRKDNLINKLLVERDVFGKLLIQRNAEQGLLQSRQDVMDQVFQKASSAYMKKLADIDVLRLEIKGLRRQLKTYENNYNFIKNLREDLCIANRCLVQEKLKRSHLEHAYQPQIHQWRTVLASEPSTYELYQKIYHLTKRLINKTGEVVDKDKLLHQRNIQFNQFKTIMMRRVDPKLAPEVTSMRKVFDSQKTKIKCLLAELNMTRDDLKKATTIADTKQSALLKARKDLHDLQKLNKKPTRKTQFLEGKRMVLPSIDDKIKQEIIGRQLKSISEKKTSL